MVNGYFVCEYGLVPTGRVRTRRRRLHGYRALWSALGFC